MKTSVDTQSTMVINKAQLKAMKQAQHKAMKQGHVQDLRITSVRMNPMNMKHEYYAHECQASSS